MQIRKRKFLMSLAMASACIMPVATKAAEPVEVGEAVIKFLPQLQKSLIPGEDDSKKFTDAIEPSVIDVEPINDVNEFLPEELYPQTIDTSTLLSLIKPRINTFVIIDLETGKSFEAMRYGGNKHLDVEPKSQTDSDALNSLGHSWDRRSVVLYFDGNFYAASMNTMPHGNGYQSENGYNGHVCVHVLGSRTHGGGRVCNLHQAMIKKALNTDIAQIVSAISATSNQNV